MQASVFYYTHNLISPKILKITLESAITHCNKNNCELILSSHYPLTKTYDRIFMGYCNHNKKNRIYDYICKNMVIEPKNIQYRAIVTGQLPYSIKTILKQLLLSCHYAQTNNIILMEHDCLYPENYVYSVIECLKKYDISYCKDNTCFLIENGFFKATPHVYMSSFSFKKDIFKKILLNKIRMFNDYGFTTIEPMLKSVANSDEYDSEKKKKLFFENEMFLDDINNICLDGYLGENKDILELVHGLNSSKMFIYLKYFAESGKDCVEHYRKAFFQEHKYWGNMDKYKELISTKHIDEKTILKSSHGTLTMSV